MSATEDEWSATIVPRLVAAGADLDRVFQVNAIKPEGLEGTLRLPEDTKRLEEKILEHDVALVLLDPLMSTVNAKLDSHKDAEVRTALDPLVRLAHETRASLVGLIHVNKSQEGDLMNRLMASRALTAVPRGFLFCASYKPIETLDDSDQEDHLTPNRTTVGAARVPARPDQEQPGGQGHDLPPIPHGNQARRIRRGKPKGHPGHSTLSSTA